MHYSPTDFLNCEPLVSPTMDAREKTLLIGCAVFLGFMAGISFSIMVARVSGVF